MPAAPLISMAAAICRAGSEPSALTRHSHDVDVLARRSRPGKRFRVDAGGRARRDREVELQELAAVAGVRLACDRRAGGTDVERPLFGGLRETDGTVRPPASTVRTRAWRGQKTANARC